MSRTFRHLHRVTYAECTLGDHVYHSRYLDLLEAARGEFLRAAGQPVRALQEAGYIFPIIEARVCYRRPARYDDLLAVEVRPLRVAGIRLEVFHRVTREDGTVILEAETRHVCTGLDEKPRRLPPGLVAALSPHLPTPAGG